MAIEDVRDFWMNVALGLKDEIIDRGNRAEELEQRLHEQAITQVSIGALCYNALRTDGGHHKQWFLEEILKLVTKPEEYERISHEWKSGIAP